MLRVGLGHPGAVLGRPPKLFGDGTLLVGLMCGDPGAFGSEGIHGSARLCSRWFLVSYGERG